MAATITVDGANGPGLVLTDVVFNNVTSFTLDADKQMIALNFADGSIRHIAITPATITVTVVNFTTYTISIQSA